MSGQERSNHPRRWAMRRRSVSVVLAMLIAIAAAAPTSAATVTTTWQARVGSGGANGLVKIQAFSTDTGTVTLKLAKLKPSTSLPVVLSKGTCGSVGSTVLTLASIRTTSAGSASRTSSLTAANVSAIKSATRGTGKIAIRIGNRTTGGVKCGLFAILAVAPPPPPPPAVGAAITVGYLPLDVVALTPAAVWVANGVGNSLSRIDPATNTVLSTVTLGQPGSGFPVAAAAGDGALWVSVVSYDMSTQTALPGSVLRVDPGSGQVAATIPGGRNGLDIAASPGAVWVANYDDGTISRIDTAANAVAATITLAAGVSGIAYGEGAIWVANEKTTTVSRIDPATNQVVATIPTVGVAEGVAAGAGAIWVANSGTERVADGVLSRIDPATNQVVRTIPLGMNPAFVAFGGGYAWVAMNGEPTVVQVNVATNAVQSRVSVGGPCWGIAATGHAVWVVQPNMAGVQVIPPQTGTVTRINF